MQKRYGKSSEQMPLTGQTSLFDNPKNKQMTENIPQRRSDNEKLIKESVLICWLLSWLKSSEYYFKSLYDILKRPILHADETYYTALESETAKTYYWVFLSGKHDDYGITLYHHDPHRSGQVALDFLNNYPGYLHYNMRRAYQQLPEATLVDCWAHVRRRLCRKTQRRRRWAKEGLLGTIIKQGKSKPPCLARV